MVVALESRTCLFQRSQPGKCMFSSVFQINRRGVQRMSSQTSSSGQPGTRGNSWRLATVAAAMTFAGAVCGIGRPVAAQMPAEASRQALKVPADLEVQLFAAEPMVVNPIALDVDTYGRVWVTEGVNYRRNVKNPPDNKIKVLEDTDGDGQADKVTVFTSDLNAAMGVCVAGSKIYVPESPHLYVYEDANNDLKPDGPRKILLSGFGGKNHDHGTHGQILGPDHKLYMTVGDSGYDVTGPDGKRIQFKWGGMVRCELDGTQLEDFAVNFRNPFELAVDSYGNVWCSDNDNDGLKSVRICWILEGGNYGWFGGPEMIQNADGSFDPIHHWRADKPGFVPYTLITGFGSPAGMTFYEGGALGPKFRNQIVHCDPGPREVRLYSLKRTAGVGFGIGLENIVTSTDGYFRPIDPRVAPDGALFFSDWYDGGVGGHAYNDPTRGRIYRLAPKGKKLERRERPGPYHNDADALPALASPNSATAFLARERLISRKEQAIPALTPLLGGSDPLLKARALWVLDRIGTPSARQAILAQLQSDSPATRAQGVRILRRHGPQYARDIAKLANDGDGEVFKETLLATRSQPEAARLAAVISGFQRYRGDDRFLLETLGIAARGLEEQVYRAVVNPAVAADSRLVSIVRLLHPRQEIVWYAAQLNRNDVTSETQRQLLSALATSPASEAGLAVAELAARREVEILVRQEAFTFLRRNLAGSWKKLRDDPALRRAFSKALADNRLKAQALTLIGEQRLPGFTAEIQAVLADSRSEANVLLAAVRAGGNLKLDGIKPALLRMVKSPDASVREGAVQALVTLGETPILSGLLADEQTVAATKELVVDLLTRTTDGAIFLLRLIDTKKLPGKLADRAIASASVHPDVNVRLLYQKFIPPERRPKTLGQAYKPDDILKMRGDELRGQNIFQRSTAAQCGKCHRVRGRGADIGPDLTQIGRKYARPALLEAIMNPSAGIAPEYIPYVVELKSGRVAAGFLNSESPRQIVLKTIDGTLLTIPRDEIEDISKQTVSLMPELVLQNITAQDAADLLAFLASLQNAMVHGTRFEMLGPFPHRSAADRNRDFGPETLTRLDPQARFAGAGENSIGWRTVEAESIVATPGMLDLRKAAADRKLAETNVSYYLAALIDSPAAQPAVLHMGSDDGIQAWLNGRKVHDTKLMRKLLTGEDQVPVQLQSGKNLVLLKMSLRDGPGRLTLSVEARTNVSFVAP